MKSPNFLIKKAGTKVFTGSGKAIEQKASLKFLSFHYYCRFTEFMKIAYPLIKKSVIDIGCGEGSLASEFTNYVGTDISEDFVRTASQYTGKTFIKADAQSLPVKNKSFDYFVSRHLLEHVKNPEKVLREMRRVCKIGGIIEVPTREFSFIADPANRILLWLNKKPVKYGVFGFGHQDLYSADKWQELIEKNGFRVVEKYSVAKGFFANLATFVDNLLFSWRGDYPSIPSSYISKNVVDSFKKFYYYLQKIDPKIFGPGGTVYVVKKSR